MDQYKHLKYMRVGHESVKTVCLHKRKKKTALAGRGKK